MLACSASTLALSNNEFEQWQKKRNQQFEQYLSQTDREFGRFLKQRWVSKTLEYQTRKPEPPKIITPPTAPLQTPNHSTEQPEVVIKERRQELDLPEVGINRGNIDFFGRYLNFAPLVFSPLPLAEIDADGIATSWQVMAANKSPVLLQQLAEQSQRLNLDDWAQAQLTYRVIKQLATGLSENQIELYTWYYLVQLGMDVRVGFDDGYVHLLLNVKQNVYAQKFFRLEGKKYYFVDFTAQGKTLGNTIQTYQQQHQQAQRAIVIDLAKTPKLSTQAVSRQLHFEFEGRKFDVAVPYSKSNVALLNTYPQIDLPYYFDSALAPDSKRVLLDYLSAAIAGKSEQQAVNLLLRFVQKAFAYQTDDQQFNEENFLAATETLHYPYADCEDRSVLFAYLVKNLLGNDIVGVLYKGHIATAVKLNTEIEGAGYRIDGDKYYVADPTYIGANLGQVMPGYERARPELIRIKKS